MLFLFSSHAGCRYNGDVYNSGDTWAAHDDPCRTFQCRVSTSDLDIQLPLILRPLFLNFTCLSHLPKKKKKHFFSFSFFFFLHLLLVLSRILSFSPCHHCSSTAFSSNSPSLSLSCQILFHIALWSLKFEIFLFYIFIKNNLNSLFFLQAYTRRLQNN